MTTTHIEFGAGAAANLAAHVRERGARTLLLVCGDATFHTAGVREVVASLPRFHRFGGFRPNARIEDVERGVAAIRALQPELVVAIGGGTAIDLAKAMRALAPLSRPARMIIEGREPLDPAPRRPPLIALPTTAGTGAEVTPFSAVYIDGVKHSLDHPLVAPDEAIVDPDLSASMPRMLAASAGADAICQSIESYWSIRSTSASRALAREALQLALAHLEPAVLDRVAASRAAMSRAALLSGRAIAITRTTAPHAVSYALAAHTGLPHGNACSITLPDFFEFTAGVTDDDATDPRGAAFVRQAVAELAMIAPPAALRALFALVELATSLPPSAPVQSIASAVDAARAANHPRRVTPHVVASILAALQERHR